MQSQSLKRTIVGLSIRMHYLLAFAYILIFPAETPADVVTFPGAAADGFSAVSEVKGDLELPEPKTGGKLPVVLVLHGSAGIDGRGEFYGKELNATGIGTLEIFMFSRGNRPRAGRNENLTHMYGALKYLASRPEIDARRIGVIGFSWGGGLSLTGASANITQLFTGRHLRFAAHAPFYPVCWSHLRMTSDRKASGYGRYKTLTGAPVLIFAGGEDDYDEPDTCQKFIASLDEGARSHVSLKYYPTATHGWDIQGRARLFYENSAALGRGGKVRMTPDQEIAGDSRRTVVEFFVRHLSAASKPNSGIAGSE